jgi:hypothetical protein
LICYYVVYIDVIEFIAAELCCTILKKALAAAAGWVVAKAAALNRLPSPQAGATAEMSQPLHAAAAVPDRASEHESDAAARAAIIRQRRSVSDGGGGLLGVIGGVVGGFVSSSKSVRVLPVRWLFNLFQSNKTSGTSTNSIREVETAVNMEADWCSNLIRHLVPHSRIIPMHLIVALHDLKQKLHLYNYKFGSKR